MPTREPTAPEAPAGALPRSWIPALLAVWTGLMALSYLQSVLTAQGLGQTGAWRAHLGPRLLYFATGLLYIPVLLLILRRNARAERGWVADVAPLLASAAALALLRGVHPEAVERFFLGPVVFRGSRAAKVIGEFVGLVMLAGAGWVLEHRRRLRERETHALQLQARLAEARLDALSTRLQPHFLFNTLNALSVLIHRDPAAADLTLTRLADLLRATLRTPAAHEIPLAEEMALLGRYVDIMRVRYGPRLAVELSVPAALGDARVPPFLLQPLVENALEHGIARRAGEGRVEVAGEAADGRLRLVVADDGPGPGAAPARGGEGIGLGSTRARLEALYGVEGRLALEPAPGGGTRAVVELPLRRFPAGEGRA
ncbi:MAG TPA: histidine kinase [Longimicrobiaceae bacterium]